MTVLDLVFYQHEIASVENIHEEAISGFSDSVHGKMAGCAKALRSKMQAVVKFDNGTRISVIASIPEGTNTVSDNGKRQKPTYEVAIIKAGQDATVLINQSADQVDEILEDAGRHLYDESDIGDWIKIADEADDNVPEMIKSVYRKGDDTDRYLVLLDKHGTGFFGLTYMPRPSDKDDKLPIAHVDLKILGDSVCFTSWDWERRREVFLNALTDEPKAIKDFIDAARNDAAGFVEQELYRQYYDQ